MEVNHIAFIVDGNGRWAKNRGFKRSEGHKEGAKRIEELILYMARKNIANYVSFYVFSVENFKRPKEEVDFLMNLFFSWFKRALKLYKKENIKIVFSGNKKYLDKKVIDSIDTLTKETKDNTGLVVNFCLAYSGRDELVEATKSILTKYSNGDINIDDVNEEFIGKNLYQDLPDVDFLIRTSGEIRISNFMLWQLSYAELYFPNTYFPDFKPDDLDKAIDEYKKRNRRFGNIKEES